MLPRLALFLLACHAFAQTAVTPRADWWMKEPIRWIQTNIRETDATLDPQRLVDQLSEFKANTLLIGMGGIAAFYPTRVEFHHISPYLPAGRDMFGDVIRLGHARGIRVVGRFDFSKTVKPVYDAHPDWFFRQANGEPVEYNGLYSTCINGPYYSEKAIEILAEAVSTYPVDGVFFNMFNNPSTDYSGKYVGLCHCDNCRRLFRARYGRELPDKPDADYVRFLYDGRHLAAQRTREIIKAKRPEAGVFHYMQDVSDGIMSESNTSVTRPLPLWPYASSDHVNRARNSQSSKMAVNLCMSFVDFPWRFATVPPNEIRIRLWENVANGGALAMNMHGTMDQQDRQALDAARPIYQWLARHERYYAGEESVARVLLLGEPAGSALPDAPYRGFFRLLSEEHIPFAVADNLDWIGERNFDLVIATNWAPPELDAWVRTGGRLLVASPEMPGLDIGKAVTRHKAVRGYVRIRSHDLFPSLRATSLMMLNSDFTEMAGESPLTLIPESMFGPPEKVHVDMKDTDKPALLLRDIGKGRVAWVPWDAAALYYRHSLPAHAGMLRDLMDHLLPNGRQLTTNAHPLVETILMRQGDTHLLHLINLTGHSQTAYFDPLPVSSIEVRVKGDFRKAQALRAGAPIGVTQEAGFTKFTLPALSDYELVELQ